MLIFQKKKTIAFVQIVFISLFLFFGGQGTIYGERSSKDYRLNKEFLNQFGNDFVEVLKAPKDWKKNDIKNLGIVLGASLLFFTVDGEIQRWFENHQEPTPNDLSQFFSGLGNGVFIGALITSLYASGEFFHQSSLRKTALLSLESWVISGVIISGLKFIIGRSRPYLSNGKTDFHPFSLNSGFQSFPSGHCSSAFAVASVIADRSQKFAVDLLSYSLATLVAVSRAHKNKHWASDVFIGSAIGYFVGKKISALSRGRDSGKIKVNLQFSPRSQAVSFSFSF